MLLRSGSLVVIWIEVCSIMNYFVLDFIKVCLCYLLDG